MAKILISIAVGLLLTACSGGDDKGDIEKLTDKTADKLTHSIKDPLDKARQAAKAVEKKYAKEE